MWGIQVFLSLAFVIHESANPHIGEHVVTLSVLMVNKIIILKKKKKKKKKIWFMCFHISVVLIAYHTCSSLVSAHSIFFGIIF